MRQSVLSDSHKSILKSLTSKWIRKSENHSDYPLKMADELKTKRLELLKKQTQLQKELAQICCAIGNVEKEIEDNEEQNEKKPDPHIESIRQWVCIVRGLKKEDVEPMIWDEYVYKKCDELPSEFRRYFIWKEYAKDQLEYDKIMIVDTKDNTYSFVWNDTLDDMNGKYVIVFPNWPNRF